MPFSLGRATDTGPWAEAGPGGSGAHSRWDRGHAVARASSERPSSAASAVRSWVLDVWIVYGK